MPGGDRPSDSVCSYSSVHDAVSAKTKSYVQKYQQFIVSYVEEWEKTVTTRIDNGLKKAEEQRRELDHYQKKVESLRLTTNKAMAQGKSVKSDTAEKLKRNEEKLVTAKQTYNKLTSALCLLMDEVAERSWRDLHPLLIKCAQFDMTMAQDESRILSSFSQVVNKLKEVATANGISPQHRLKDLGSLNPELLTTRPGGASGLAIEASTSLSPTASVSPTSSFSAGGGGIFDPMALPPGSMGAQGMGGFPVAVASNNPPSGNVSRASSFSSYASGISNPPNEPQPPSTLSMLTISQSSAPAPTMDDIYSSSYTYGGGSRSAPSTGNLPPLPPSTTPTSAYSQGGRAGSFGDFDAYSSGPVAAPPACPPPPPPPGGVYGGYGAPAPAPASYGGPWGAPPTQPSLSPYGMQSTTTSPPSTNTNPFAY